MYIFLNVVIFTKRNDIIYSDYYPAVINHKSIVAVNSLWISVLVPVDFFRIFHYNITLVLAREIPGGRFKCTLGEASSSLLSRGRGKISHCFERQYCRRRVFRHCPRLSISSFSRVKITEWRDRRSGRENIVLKRERKKEGKKERNRNTVLRMHREGPRRYSINYELVLAGNTLSRGKCHLHGANVRGGNFRARYIFFRTRRARRSSGFMAGKATDTWPGNLSRSPDDRDWLLINCAACLVNRLIVR